MRNWETLFQSVGQKGIPQGVDERALAYVLGLSWPVSRFVLSESDRVLSAFLPSNPAPEWGQAVRAGLRAIAKKPPAERVHDDSTRGAKAERPFHSPSPERSEGGRPRSGAEGAAEKMEALQVLRQSLTVEILAQELMGRLDQKAVEGAITLVADALVEEALHVYRGPDLTEKDFFILAMGKFGAAEMTYESDLDLIFLHNTENGEAVIRSAQRFIRDISTLGPSGLLYAVDADLRPHGRGGVLVISQEGFLKYHRESREMWEKQALIKARPLGASQILGDPNGMLVRRGASSDAPSCREGLPARSRREDPPLRILSGTSNLKSQIDELVYEKRDPREVFRNVHEMKLTVEKAYAPIGSSFIDLKFGRGGTMDIEFLTQAGQLAFGHEVQELRTRSTRGAIHALERTGWLSAGEARTLAAAYDEFKKIIGRIRLVEGKAGNQISPSKMNYPSVVRASTWPDEKRDAESFLDRLKQFMLSVRKIYEQKIDG